jgi:excisionase family DNA binding protein
MERLFSIDAAAEFLGGISKWTIQSWLTKRTLRRTKIGRRTFIRESELLKVIRDDDDKASR